MRLSVAAAVACLSIIGLASADDVRAAIRKPTNIPAESLSAALQQLAKDRNFQIVYVSEEVNSLRTAGAVGEFSTEEALKELLKGTGMTYRYLDEKTVTILPASTTSGTSGNGATSPGSPPPTSASGDTQKNSTAQRFLLAQAAQGQTVSSPSAAEKPAEEDILQQVVVTGSRIAQTGYNTPSPVSITSEAQIERTGVSNIYDLLNRSPVFGTGIGGAVEANDITGEIGASFVNLRGLGTNRTLVLVDGERRVSGSSKTSAVDLSSIPTNMIDRIEVVTGGAAAVYGADAVSGAVNVILKDQVNGVELNAQTGLSSHHDAGSYTAGILAGGQLGDRGHITFGVSYDHEDSLFQSQRAFSRNYINEYSNPAYAGPDSGTFENIAYNNSRFPNTAYSGAFYIGGTDPAHHYTYNNGVLRLVQNDALPLPFLGIGGDGFNGADFNGLRPETSIVATLVHMTYALSDSVTLTSDFQFSHNHAIQEQQPLFGFAYPIARDNPYLPAPVGALMDANGLTTLAVGRTDTDQGLTGHNDSREMYTAVTKLDGKISGNVAWQVYGQYGQFDDSDIFENERIQSRFLDALNVIQGPNGPECASATARANGCQPLNIFGTDVATPGALAYFHTNPVTYTTNTQTVLGGQLNGDLFSLPAGSAKFSVGAEYRQETIDERADPLATEGALFYGHGANLSGEFNVKEQFAEVLVPLVANAPLVKSLDLSAAARESEYSTIGHTFTWKGGLVYAPVDYFHLRVTQSRSVRAPNLNELFSTGALSQSPDNYQDPCDITQINLTPNRAANCYALGIPHGYVDPNAGKLRFVNAIGNPNLSAETSDSTTVGVVVQLSGLSGSLDYYTMRIKDAINTLNQDDVLSGCVDGPTPNPVLCPLVVRAADHSIPYVDLVPLNIGALHARGLDLSLDYRFTAGTLWAAPLKLGVSLVGNYDLSNDAVLNTSNGNVAGNVFNYAGSSQDPTFRGNLTFSADAGGRTTVSWTARYISRSKVDLNVPAYYRNDNNLTARLYNDVYVRRGLTDQVSVGAGVNNIFNIVPPYSFYTYTGTGVDGAIYDNIGTYFFANIYAKF
jgi:iron complex outermembrane recepter protein